jgi:hypothetical protein
MRTQRTPRHPYTTLSARGGDEYPALHSIVVALPKASISQTIPHAASCASSDDAYLSWPTPGRSGTRLDGWIAALSSRYIC